MTATEQGHCCKVALESIEWDTSIQCRAALDVQVIHEYAERMTAGDDFPRVEVCGTKKRCWIADGWHRVNAAREINAKDIKAMLYPGGRVTALKRALGANAQHGHRRSNADKRRSVEIALREFPKLSSRAIAEMCGVGKDMVQAARPSEVAESANAQQVVGSTRPSAVTTTDGRQYPAHREPARRAEPAERPVPEPVLPAPAVTPAQTHDVSEGADSVPARSLVLGPPADGMQFARMAIMDLERIRQDDVERDAALAAVERWIANAREA